MNRFLICFLLISPWSTSAQKSFEIGLLGGFANYQGDLATSQIELSETKVSYGAFLRYHVSEKVKFKINGYLGFISGSDENSDNSLRSRGWSFESSLLEVAAVAEFHPLGKARYGSTGIFEKHVSPYVFVGAGMVNTDPKIKVTKAGDEGLFPEGDFNPTFLTLPFGAGVQFDLMENLSIGFEGGWRMTFNDYLDGVSKNGNSDKNDLYIFLGATVSYVFPGEAEELEF